MELWTPNGNGIKRQKVDKPKPAPKSKSRSKKQAVETEIEPDPEDELDLEPIPSTSQIEEEMDEEAIHENLQIALTGSPKKGKAVRPSRAKKDKEEKPPKEEGGFSPFHFKNDKSQTYMPFVRGNWMPQTMFRLPQDIILDAIRKNGSEGIGRAELGRIVGLDATKKAGGRRVTNWINHCLTECPNDIGQFQKMEGKIRTIRYYWKQSEQPEQFQELFREFKDLCGQDCPYKIGEVIKFPDMKLNTLRISDVSLKRLNRLLRITNENRVVVTINRMVKFISEEETAEGYKYQIDKKSLMKCILALKTKKLLNIWESVVRSEAVDYQIQIIAHREVTSVNDEEVTIAIQSILETYNQEGRVFPHGQLRNLKSRGEYAVPPRVVKGEYDGELIEIKEDLSKPITITERFHLFRLQNVRNSYRQKSTPPDAPKSNEDVEKETIEVDLDETIDSQSSMNASSMEVEDEEIFEMNSAILAGSGYVTQPRKSGYWIDRDGLGYQCKVIRMILVHEMAFHFVHGKTENGNDLSSFDLFPPNLPFDNWTEGNERNAYVFVNEESPYRYMPTMKEFSGAQRGWFMLTDFLAALPISVLVMIAHIPKTVDRDLILSYASDPLKRHLCVGYLPAAVRKSLMMEKKIHKQIEHLLLVLAAMGLTAIGPNPAFKRFPGANSSMFFVSKKGILYDTSKSDKGYSCVTPPMEQYTSYIYEFEGKNEVTLYWHHLRAIVQSTPLAYRMEESISVAEPQNVNRHKTYSIGVFNKKLVEHSYEDAIDMIQPLEPHEGVAGFDSAMFLHLKRHWDLTPAPHRVVSWFLTRFRKDSDDLRCEIESRVAKIQKDWNSFVKALMPTDLELYKNKKQMVSTEFPKTPANKIKTRPAAQRPAGLLPGMKKKRKLDSVDMVSASTRVNVRCRFSPKERDQLIMIRAVGFFLNPVYRFWLDPTVLRDLMHEYVPESRTKTVQSLMACGVRELVRQNRLAYLQRVVRNLSTFPEMKKLRYELCVKPPQGTEAKTEYFKNAFRMAMRLLFVDNNRIPHTMVTDKEFKKFLFDANVSVVKESSASNPLPFRSRKAMSINHINCCAVNNIMLSVLLHTKNGQISESILNQVTPTVIHSVLQSLRADGLVSRNRAIDPSLDVSMKNQAGLSYYFRHFFAHRYHPELVNGCGAVFGMIEDEIGEEMFELLGDAPALVVAAATAFYDPGYILEMNMDDDLMDVFVRAEEDQTTKKIRYLESANLHFEKLHVYLDRVGAVDDQAESVNAVLQVLDKSRPVLLNDDVVPFDFWVQQFEIDQRSEYRKIMDAIKTSNAAGLTQQELVELTFMSEENILHCLKNMSQHQQVLECGVDDTRWVSMEYESVWTITIADRKYCPRPWILPYGGICLSTVRWMAESILMCVVGKLGILLKDILFNYDFAIQPIIVLELIDVLVKAECVEVVTKHFKTERLESPFDEPVEEVEVKYVVPTVKAMEKFSKMFHGISFLPTMIPTKSTDDKLNETIPT